MSRREVREQIFKLLFRAEFYEEGELPEQLQLFFEELDQTENKDTIISGRRWSRFWHACLRLTVWSMG